MGTKVQISERNTKGKEGKMNPRIIAAPYQGALNLCIPERARSALPLLQSEATKRTFDLGQRYEKKSRIERSAYRFFFKIELRIEFFCIFEALPRKKASSRQ